MKCVLASASWDKTVKLWDMLDSWRTKETLIMNSDGNLFHFSSFIKYKNTMQNMLITAEHANTERLIHGNENQKFRYFTLGLG